MKKHITILVELLLLWTLLDVIKTTSFPNKKENNDSSLDPQNEAYIAESFTNQGVSAYIINPGIDENSCTQQNKYFSGCTLGSSGQGCVLVKDCKVIEVPRIGPRYLCKTQIKCY